MAGGGGRGSVGDAVGSGVSSSQGIKSGGARLAPRRGSRPCCGLLGVMRREAKALKNTPVLPAAATGNLKAWQANANTGEALNDSNL